MQPDVDGQGRGLRQLLLSFSEHLYGAHVLWKWETFLTDTPDSIRCLSGLRGTKTVT